MKGSQRLFKVTCSANWHRLFVGKSIKKCIGRAITRLNRWALPLAWIVCIFVIYMIVYDVAYLGLRTNHVSPIGSNLIKNISTAISNYSGKKTVNIKIETLSEAVALNTHNIYLSEFSGEYEEIPTSIKKGSMIQKYNVDEIYFALTTNTQRIRTTIHYLKFWATLPDINCLLVFEQKDFVKTSSIAKYLIHEGVSCKIQISNITFYEERYLELFRLAWNTQTMINTNRQRKKIQWFAVGDDDTVWFINNLLHTLHQYNSSKLTYLGNISNKKSSEFNWGTYFAYGGGGVLLSRPLTLLFVQHCKYSERLRNKVGGDGMIGKCITEKLNVTLTKNEHFHQMDHKGDMTGILESGIDGLVSLHHMFSFWKPFPDKHTNSLNETMHLLHIAYNMFDKELFKRYLRVNHKTNQSFLLTTGYSFSILNRIISHSELSLVEKTWCCDELIGKTTRPKEYNKTTWYFQRLLRKNSSQITKYGSVYLNKNSKNGQFSNIKVTFIHGLQGGNSRF